MKDTCSWSIILISKVLNQRFEWLHASDRPSLDDDENQVLCLSMIGIIVVGRYSGMPYIDGLLLAAVFRVANDAARVRAFLQFDNEGGVA